MSIVLRFLAGTQPEEIQFFLDLLSEPVKHFKDGDCCSAVIRAVEDLDVSKVLPVGRQHGVLNSLEIVLKNISHLISAYLPKILQILLCMTAAISHILDQREKIQLRFINPLKNLRRLGIKMVTDIFWTGSLTSSVQKKLMPCFMVQFGPRSAGLDLRVSIRLLLC